VTFDLTINACMSSDCHALNAYTNSGVDSSSHFPFTARTHKQTHSQKETLLISLPTHAAAGAGLGVAHDG